MRERRVIPLSLSSSSQECCVLLFGQDLSNPYWHVSFPEKSLSSVYEKKSPVWISSSSFGMNFWSCSEQHRCDEGEEDGRGASRQVRGGCCRLVPSCEPLNKLPHCSAEREREREAHKDINAL